MALSSRQTDWTVLLIGGPSGAGKTILAKQVGLHFGISWLEVDDLWLVLLRSRVILPEGQDSAQRHTQNGCMDNGLEM